MKIYTGRGDAGRTDLRSADRVSKASARIEAYGTVDELNALVGRARPTGYDDADDPQVEADHAQQLEEWMDAYDEELEPLTDFVLPGGGDAGARLHHARTVCRRAERRTVALADQEDINENVRTYLNRLSDALFVLARVVNQRDNVPEENPTY